MTDPIWGDDLLGRSEEGRLLIDFLVRRSEERKSEGQHGSYVLNISAPWGKGKSFFLNRLRLQLAAEGHIAAYVSAWRDDASGEPMVAVMSSVEEALRPYLGSRPKVQAIFASVVASGGKLVTAGMKGMAKQVGQKAFGEALDGMISEVGDGALFGEEAAKDAAESMGEDTSEAIASIADATLEKRLSAYRQRQKSVDTFKAQMARLIKQLDGGKKVKAPLFILIDELDRCRPLYAISMLEEIKHLFDIDGVVFVVATDTGELSHAVKAVYGQGFDSPGYLHRFFHRRYVFADPPLEAFVRSLFNRHAIPADKLESPPGNDHVGFFVGGMKFFDLSLRDAEQCFDMLRSFVTVWSYDIPIQMLFLLPLIIAHQRGELGEGRWPQKYLSEFKPKGDPWTISFGHRRDAHGRASPEWTKVIGLATDMFNQANHPLHEANIRDNDGFARHWLVMQFRREHERLHKNMINQRKSIMLSYADGVRRIGRLSQTAED